MCLLDIQINKMTSSWTKQSNKEFINKILHPKVIKKKNCLALCKLKFFILVHIKTMVFCYGALGEGWRKR